MTPIELATLVEFAEAAAWADMLRAAPASMGFHVEVGLAAVTLMAPGIDLLLFNRVIGLGLREPATRETLDEAAARFRAAGVSNFGVQASPEAQQASLGGWLTTCDLHLRDYWTKVYRDRSPCPDVPTELRIAEVEPGQAETFGQTACAGFGMPMVLAPVLGATVGRDGWRHYLAHDGDTPAATAALFVSGEVGWLGAAATLASYRRRGGQGALMARRIQDGIALGCQWFVTETGQDRPDKPNPSFHNMLRNGFTVAYERPNFMPPKAAPPPR